MSTGLALAPAEARSRTLLVGLTAVLAVAAVISLFAGRVLFPPLDVLKALFGHRSAGDAVELIVGNLLHRCREPAHKRSVLLPVRMYISTFSQFDDGRSPPGQIVQVDRHAHVQERTPVGLLWLLGPPDEAMFLEPFHAFVIAMVGL